MTDQTCRTSPPDIQIEANIGDLIKEEISRGN